MMNPEMKTPAPIAALLQRRSILGSALLLGGLLAAAARAQVKAQSTLAAMPDQEADRMRTSIHQEIDFKASAERLYEALLDSKQFSAFSGEAAQIDRRAGGAFSLFGGKIVGRNIELVPNERIVQAWRPANWDPGVYSIAKFELRRRGAEVHIVFDHTGFPQGGFEHLDEGWKIRYWDPLEKFIA